MEGQASPDANLAEGNLCILTGLVLLASCFRRAPVPSGRINPILPPASSSVYASLWLLAESQARLEAGIKSLLLFRRALSPPTMCRFIPALSDA